MAEKQFKTREEARTALQAQLEENSRKLRQAIRDNDKEAIDRLYKENKRLKSQLTTTSTLGNVSAGLLSTAVGAVTGLPDLAIAGYNLYQEGRAPSPSELVTGKTGLFGEKAGQLPTLRERVLGAVNAPIQAAAEEDQLTYSAPDIAAGVYGLTSLAKMGAKGIKNWFDNKRTKDLLSRLTPQEQNTFKDLMLKGQGSPDAVVAAQLAKLKRDPKFTELFSALEREASVRATKGLAPTAAKLTPEEAATGAAQGVQAKIQKLTESRKLAGDLAFNKAFGYGAGNKLVSPTKTLEKIDELIARYSEQTTPNAKSAVNVLTSIREQLQPTQTAAIPGRAGYTTPRAATEMVRDASGMLRPVQTVENINIPATGGTTIQYRNAPEALTAEQVQGILSEFGKKASQGDSLIKDLALSDERIISSAIFGGMKDDLNTAYKAATGNDKVALAMLVKGRKEVADASEAYNSAIAQGIPAWLKDKPLSAINFEDFYSQYKNAAPSQRATFRAHIQNTNPEELNVFDNRVWSEFMKKYETTLADGMLGTDIAKMAKDWEKMLPNEKDAVSLAIGQKTSDFDQRMKDALVFTRKLKTGQPEDVEQVGKTLTRETAALAGASAGYQTSKAVQIAGDLLTFARGGISNDLAMKVLLSPEGASFLKTAKLSPGGKKTLDALTAVTTAKPKAPTWMALGAAVAPVSQGQPEAAMPAEEEFIMPEELQDEDEDQKGFVMPEELQGGFNVGNIRASGQGFREYATPEEAVAAVVKNASSYPDRFNQGNPMNILEIGQRWAPAADNNDPAAWAKNVASISGLDLNQPLDFTNPYVRSMFAKGVHGAEFGQNALYSDDIYFSGAE